MKAFVRLSKISKTFSGKGGFFSGEPKITLAVKDVSVFLEEGRIVAFVGESGSGKTTVGRIAANLIFQTSGQVERTTFPQMIFQNPALSFNPRIQMAEALMEPLLYQGVARKIALADAIEKLHEVGLSEEHLDRYPHQFSLGQKQRLAIARALITNPKIVIADEIVSSLDLSVQSQILKLLVHLCKEKGIGFVFISHDIACVRAIAEWVYVFYKGSVIEEGKREAVLENPQESYTRELLNNERFFSSKS